MSRYNIPGARLGKRVGAPPKVPRALYRIVSHHTTDQYPVQTSVTEEDDEPHHKTRQVVGSFVARNTSSVDLVSQAGSTPSNFKKTSPTSGV